MNFAICAHNDHTRFVYGDSCSVTEISAVCSLTDIRKLQHLLMIQYEAGKRDALKTITQHLENVVHGPVA